MRSVNRMHTRRPGQFVRTAALFLALIVCGISGGTTLFHTEELLPAHARAAHGLARLTAPAVAAPAADACPACQWENALFRSPVPAVPLPAPVFFSLPLFSASVQTRTCDPFDHTAPRAPPLAS